MIRVGCRPMIILREVFIAGGSICCGYQDENYVSYIAIRTIATGMRE